MGKRKKKSPRGWLLVEVAIGGVMASAIVGALLINIGDANDKTTITSRQITARMLAEQGLEQMRMRGTGATASDVTAVPTSLQGTYERNCTASGRTTTTVNGVTLTHNDLSCTVTFPVHSGTGTKTVTVSTRISGTS